MISITGDNSKLYMNYEKILPSAQGMAIYDGMAFILYHTGVCGIYDLVGKGDKAISSFRLGSFNDGHPSSEHINHSNQCMFSAEHYKGNPLPLLYVTTGNSGGQDENGYYYRCAVEDIRLSKTADGKLSAKSRLIQTISYSNTGIEDSPWQTPCWGCPAWFVDSEEGCVYIFSSRYRTTEEFLEYYSYNNYIITKFTKPPLLEGSFVTLTANDITDQFELPFNILFTQGGTLKCKKIFYTFGLGDSRYPVGIRIFDLEKKCICAEIDLSHSVLASEEIECCAFYNGELLYNTNATPGSIYSLGIRNSELLLKAQ